MSDEQRQMLEVYLQEYTKLKDEQTKRIGFRDNLLYVALAVFGGVLSFSLSEETHHYALLVLPWVCLILGWTYLVNDEKISAIGRYIRKDLAKKIGEQTTGSVDTKSIFGWEVVHRSDQERSRRKIEQLIIDEVTFVFSGAVGLLAFWFLVPQPHWAVQALCWTELGLLAILGVEIFTYADRAKGQ